MDNYDANHEQQSLHVAFSAKDEKKKKKSLLNEKLYNAYLINDIHVNYVISLGDIDKLNNIIKKRINSLRTRIIFLFLVLPGKMLLEIFQVLFCKECRFL